jgi:hypothetical protein
MPAEADPLCERCGTPILGRSNTGRRKIYCTQSCRQRSYEERHGIKRLQIESQETVGQVAHWLATEYGDQIGDGPAGYWEFQARELLGVVIRAARQA